MLGVFTNDADHAFTLDDLTFVTNFLNDGLTFIYHLKFSARILPVQVTSNIYRYSAKYLNLLSFAETFRIQINCGTQK